ncbi:hypothetical protein SPHINGOT1_280080 [Sphingomonas sp. T1]|nr:hypothetical protein SPHINGOT1_280080 [Sphingomonas sp. T1]
MSRHVRVDGCAADRIYHVVHTNRRATSMMVVAVIAVMSPRAGSGAAHLLIVPIVHCCFPFKVCIRPLNPIHASIVPMYRPPFFSGKPGVIAGKGFYSARLRSLSTPMI